MPLTLYYSPGACSIAAHYALEEAGADYRLVLVSTTDGSTRKPEYLAINPKGRVPALAIPGQKRVLTEAPAILLYVALAYPGAGLLPEEPLARARVAEWLNWLSGWLHAVGFGGLWRPHRFVEEERDYAPITRKARQTILDCFRMIEDGLADGRPFLVDDRLSVADLFLLVFFRWGGRMGLAMAEAYPRWTAWARRLETRPAIARTLAQEGVSLWDGPPR